MSAAGQKLSAFPIISFRASRELFELVERVAASEGISRSAFARRALLRDLARENALEVSR
jgi:hypothetical protein